MHVPFDEIYRFRVAIYDQNSQTWSSASEFSEEYDTKISMNIWEIKWVFIIYRLFF
jgi:hypothetical protein